MTAEQGRRGQPPLGQDEASLTRALDRARDHVLDVPGVVDRAELQLPRVRRRTCQDGLVVVEVDIAVAWPAPLAEAARRAESSVAESLRADGVHVLGTIEVIIHPVT